MIQIRKLTGDAQTLFQTGKQYGSIHSVYHNVINVEMEGRLFSLHPSTLGWTPMSIIPDLSKDAFGKLEIQKQMKVIVEDQVLTIGDYQFSAAGAGCLSSTLEAENIRKQKTEFLLEDLIRGYLEHTECRTGFGGAVTGRRSVENAVETYLFGKYEKICTCITAGNRKAALAQMTELIGAGSGLTPSGDDFLVGMLFRLSLAGAQKVEWKKELTEMILDRLDATTDLSGTFLKYACEGKFGQYLLELALAFRKNEGADMIKAVKKIGTVGHSSGIDTLTGILTGCMLCRKE